MDSVKLPTKSLLFGEEEEAVVTFMTQNNSILEGEVVHWFEVPLSNLRESFGAGVWNEPHLLLSLRTTLHYMPG